MTTADPVPEQLSVQQRAAARKDGSGEDRLVSVPEVPAGAHDALSGAAPTGERPDGDGRVLVQEQASAVRPSGRPRPAQADAAKRADHPSRDASRPQDWRAQEDTSVAKALTALAAVDGDRDQLRRTDPNALAWIARMETGTVHVDPRHFPEMRRLDVTLHAAHTVRQHQYQPSARALVREWLSLIDGLSAATLSEPVTGHATHLASLPPAVPVFTVNTSDSMANGIQRLGETVTHPGHRKTLADSGWLKPGTPLPPTPVNRQPPSPPTTQQAPSRQTHPLPQPADQHWIRTESRQRLLAEALPHEVLEGPTAFAPYPGAPRWDEAELASAVGGDAWAPGGRADLAAWDAFAAGDSDLAEHVLAGVDWSSRGFGDVAVSRTAVKAAYGRLSEEQLRSLKNSRELTQALVTMVLHGSPDVPLLGGARLGTDEYLRAADEFVSRRGSLEGITRKDMASFDDTDGERVTFGLGTWLSDVSNLRRILPSEDVLRNLLEKGWKPKGEPAFNAYISTLRGLIEGNPGATAADSAEMREEAWRLFDEKRIEKLKRQAEGRHIVRPVRIFAGNILRQALQNGTSIADLGWLLGVPYTTVNNYRPGNGEHVPNEGLAKNIFENITLSGVFRLGGSAVAGEGSSARAQGASLEDVLAAVRVFTGVRGVEVPGGVGADFASALVASADLRDPAGQLTEGEVRFELMRSAPEGRGFGPATDTALAQQAADQFGLSLSVLDVRADGLVEVGPFRAGQEPGDSLTPAILVRRDAGDGSDMRWWATRPSADALLSARGQQPVQQWERQVVTGLDDTGDSGQERIPYSERDVAVLVWAGREPDLAWIPAQELLEAVYAVAPGAFEPYVTVPAFGEVDIDVDALSGELRQRREAAPNRFVAAARELIRTDGAGALAHVGLQKVVHLGDLEVRLGSWLQEIALRMVRIPREEILLELLHGGWNPGANTSTVDVYLSELRRFAALGPQEVDIRRARRGRAREELIEERRTAMKEKEATRGGGLAEASTAVVSSLGGGRRSVVDVLRGLGLGSRDVQETTFASALTEALGYWGGPLQGVSVEGVRPRLMVTPPGGTAPEAVPDSMAPQWAADTFSLDVLVLEMDGDGRLVGEEGRFRGSSSSPLTPAVLVWRWEGDGVRWWGARPNVHALLSARGLEGASAEEAALATGGVRRSARETAALIWARRQRPFDGVPDDELLAAVGAIAPQAFAPYTEAPVPGVVEVDVVSLLEAVGMRREAARLSLPAGPTGAPAGPVTGPGWGPFVGVVKADQRAMRQGLLAAAEAAAASGDHATADRLRRTTNGQWTSSRTDTHPAPVADLRAIRHLRAAQEDEQSLAAHVVGTLDDPFSVLSRVTLELRAMGRLPSGGVGGEIVRRVWVSLGAAAGRDSVTVSGNVARALVNGGQSVGLPGGMPPSRTSASLPASVKQVIDDSLRQVPLPFVPNTAVLAVLIEGSVARIGWDGGRPVMDFLRALKGVQGRPDGLLGNVDALLRFPHLLTAAAQHPNVADMLNSRPTLVTRLEQAPRFVTHLVRNGLDFPANRLAARRLDDDVMMRLFNDSGEIRAGTNMIMVMLSHPDTSARIVKAWFSRPAAPDLPVLAAEWPEITSALSKLPSEEAVRRILAETGLLYAVTAAVLESRLSPDLTLDRLFQDTAFIRLMRHQQMAWPVVVTVPGWYEALSTDSTTTEVLRAHTHSVVDDLLHVLPYAPKLAERLVRQPDFLRAALGNPAVPLVLGANPAHFDGVADEDLVAALADVGPHPDSLELPTRTLDGQQSTQLLRGLVDTERAWSYVGKYNLRLVGLLTREPELVRVIARERIEPILVHKMLPPAGAGPDALHKISVLKKGIIQAQPGTARFLAMHTATHPYFDGQAAKIIEENVLAVREGAKEFHPAMLRQPFAPAYLLAHRAVSVVAMAPHPEDVQRKMGRDLYLIDRPQLTAAARPDSTLIFMLNWARSIEEHTDLTSEETGLLAVISQHPTLAHDFLSNDRTSARLTEVIVRLKDFPHLNRRIYEADAPFTARHWRALWDDVELMKVV
ncbi:hypothetical protein, partial [Streptomyces sp. NPDC086010]|uniref:hypothetical protein n=1 Tax=Streptomyces sp. NPDC086010 TaxID=3365745 RepID=UPI0037D65B6D